MKEKLTSDIAGELYRIMFRIRSAEERVAKLYPTDKIQSPIHLSIGQEAVAAGVCHAMRRTDRIYGTYRGHGIYIAKGGEVRKMIAELYAKDTGCARGRGGSMHLIASEVGLMGCSAIVASTIPLAVGDALAAKMNHEDRVAVAFFGDGAVGEGVFFESLNFAALRQVPVIFVCENNNYAVNSPLKTRHLKTDLYRFGEPLGVEGRRFNGNDAGEVYLSMKDALEECRKHMRPLLLEYMTYRWYEHVGPGTDHGEKYRDQALLKDAAAHDPVRTAREKLTGEYGIQEAVIAKWESEILEELEEAVEFAEQSPFPPPEALYTTLYKERT